MELVFLNGNELQQAACRTAAHNLLNLPFGSINLKHTVEFTPDPLPASHNEFAATTYSYDSTEPFTKIASVAPDWPEPWRGVKFLQETYAHELGHGFFAALPEAARIAIAELFGFSTDSLTILFPSGVNWEDRPGEGIAETFKDAFLPRRFRRYANRTNHTIPIHKYAEFRSLWRQAVSENVIEVSEPDVDVSIFEQGGWVSGAWFDSRGGLYSGIDPPGSVKFQSNSSWAPFSVAGGYDFAFSWALPATIFNIAGTAQTQLRIMFRAAKGHSSSLEVWSRWTLVIVYTPESDTYSISIEENGGSIINPPEIPGATYVNKESGGVHWIEVEGVRPLLTLKCAFESTWEAEALQAMEITAETDFSALSAEEITSEAFLTEFAEPFRLTIPNFRYTVGGTSVQGVPVVIPASEIKGGAQTSGRRIKMPTIVGRNS